MKTASKAYTFEWKVFEPGDQITPVSHRGALEVGEIYTVTEFYNSLVPYALEGTVFVEGEEFGHSAEYLRLIEED